MSYSAFFSLNQTIAQTIHSIVRFYLPDGGVIYDPTCGKENFQFGDWIENAKLDGTHYEYICSDIKPYGDFQADLWHLPMQDKSVDMTVVDVPFTPSSKNRRSEEYGIQVERSVKDIMAFFSPDLYREIYRVTRSFVIVRGQDFYYPANTTTLYSFQELAISQIKQSGLALRAIYPFRYNYHRLALWRENLKNVVRPIITHGYAAVFATPEAPERRNGAKIKHIVMSPNWGNRRQRLENPLI